MASLALGVKFNPASAGSGDFVYSSAVQGYVGPAGSAPAMVDGKTYRYRAESADLSQWEFGAGVYTAASGTLARTTITLSSTGAKVAFSAPPVVGIVPFPADLLQFDDPMSLTTAQQNQARSNLGIPLGQIPGDQANLAPAAGTIGEEVHSGVTTTAGNYVSGVPQLVCSFSIPSAGDWDVFGYNDFSGSGSTQTSDWVTCISTVSSPTVTNPGTFTATYCHDRRPAGLDYALRQVIGPAKFVTTGAVTLYMYGAVTIAAGTVYTSSGAMRARRCR